jgi:hypothetical protein
MRVFSSIAVLSAFGLIRVVTDIKLISFFDATNADPDKADDPERELVGLPPDRSHNVLTVARFSPSDPPRY